MVWQRFIHSWSFWSLINYLPAQNQTLSGLFLHQRLIVPLPSIVDIVTHVGLQTYLLQQFYTQPLRPSLWRLLLNKAILWSHQSLQISPLPLYHPYISGCIAAYIRANSSGTFILESTAETRTFLPSVKHFSWLKHPINYSHTPETPAAPRCGPNPTYRAASHQLHQCTCLGWHITRRENRRCVLQKHITFCIPTPRCRGSAEIRIRKVMPQKAEQTLRDQVAQVKNLVWKGFSWDGCQVADNWYEFFLSQTWPWCILFGEKNTNTQMHSDTELHNSLQKSSGGVWCWHRGWAPNQPSWSGLKFLWLVLWLEESAYIVGLPGSSPSPVLDRMQHPWAKAQTMLRHQLEMSSSYTRKTLCLS